MPGAPGILTRRMTYMTEIGLVYGEIGEAIRKTAVWARRKRKRTPLTGVPSSSYIVREPLGCTLIMSPWNYPVQLLLNPLVGAISAGCTAILKPSPYVPHVSAALEGIRFRIDGRGGTLVPAGAKIGRDPAEKGRKRKNFFRKNTGFNLFCDFRPKMTIFAGA